MSTRAIIMVVGTNNWRIFGQPRAYTTAERLYKDSDGYPDGVLPDLVEAIRMIDKKVEQSIPFEMDCKRQICVSPMSQAIIFASMDSVLMPVVLEERIGLGEAEASDMGDDGGLEWVYVVDIPKKAVNIYKYGKASTGRPEQHVQEGFWTDIEGYVEIHVEEAKSDVRQAVKDCIAEVDALGWSVNRELDPYGRLYSQPELSVLDF